MEKEGRSGGGVGGGEVRGNLMASTSSLGKHSSSKPFPGLGGLGWTAPLPLPHCKTTCISSI